jgi:hypothetical protein
MWNLDDLHRYIPLGRFEMPWATTYGNTSPGHTDREKRERIREAAEAGIWPRPDIKQWGFRVLVRKAGKRMFDIENVPKLIVDAFCKRRIKKDGTRHAALGLYEDDTLDEVVILQIAGERADKDSTAVEIFGLLPAVSGNQTPGSGDPA